MFDNPVFVVILLVVVAALGAAAGFFAGRSKGQEMARDAKTADLNEAKAQIEADRQEISELSTAVTQYRTQAEGLAQQLTYLKSQLAQAQRAGLEQAQVHGLQAGADARRECHVGQHVAVQVDAGRQLDQLQRTAAIRLARGHQAEHAALGHIQHALAAPQRLGAAEGAVLDLAHQLARAAFVQDVQVAVHGLHLQRAGGKGADKHHGLGVLADVDEAARARQAGPELAHVEVAVLVGLRQAQGLMFSEGFYWDMDDKTRAFSARFEKLHKGFKPTMVQAGVYSSVLHYLRSVAAAKTDDWKVVAQKMRELPIDDPVMRNASIRPDGRVIHDMYLFQVKTPAESKGAWDYYKTVSTIPAKAAFKPLADSTCPLVKK
mgnify:CR=1 FL=1